MNKIHILLALRPSAFSRNPFLTGVCSKCAMNSLESRILYYKIIILCINNVLTNSEVKKSRRILTEATLHYEGICWRQKKKRHILLTTSTSTTSLPVPVWKCSTNTGSAADTQSHILVVVRKGTLTECLALSAWVSWPGCSSLRTCSRPVPHCNMPYIRTQLHRITTKD